MYLDYVQISDVDFDDMQNPSILTWNNGRSRGTIDLMLGSNNAFGIIDIKRWCPTYDPDHRQTYSKHYALSFQLRPSNYLVSMTTADECGAYVTSVHGETVLRWNADSPQWESAQWVPNLLNITYGLRSSMISGGQATRDVDVSFTDNHSGAKWNPILGDFSVQLTSGSALVFSLNSGVEPPRQNPYFPYKLSLKFDPEGNNFNGAFLSGQGVVYGINGEVSYPAIVGIYNVRFTDQSTTTIGIAGGHLFLDGVQVVISAQKGNGITWTLRDGEMLDSNLFRTGQIVFSENGDHIVHGTGIDGGERITVFNDPLCEISTPEGYYFDDNEKSMQPPTADEAYSEDDLHLQDLLTMSQFVLNGDSYEDEIQMQSMLDLMGILQYHMDPDLREKYVSVKPVDIDPTVRAIAGMQGTNGTDARAWYRELSIAYITASLAATDDPFASFLNANRASKWLKYKVGSSDVYQAQSPKLYRNRYLQKYDKMGDFINDQLYHPTKHASDIKEYKQQWLDQVRADIENETMLLDVEKTINDLCDRALNGQHWAFIYFAMITQPSSLRTMQMIAELPSHGGAEYSRRIQEHCAVLIALDQTSTFLHQYVKIMQNFQLTSIIPRLLDYSGNMNDFTDAVSHILMEFIQMYGSDDDPGVRLVADELHDALDMGQIRLIIAATRKIAGTVSGIYGWEIIAQKLEESPELKKWSGRVVRIVAIAGSVCAYVGFIMSAQGWDKMDAAARVGLIVGGTTMVIQMIFNILKRGVALKEVWNDMSIKWFRIDMILGDDVLLQASTKSLKGFKRWLLGGEEVATISTEAAEVVEAVESRKVITGVFGKNLSTFWATRIAAVLSIINIVLMSINMAKGGMDDLQLAENSLFMISTCLDLIATIGTWAVTDGILATVFGSMGPLAIGVAFIGAILMIVEISKPLKGPIQMFAEGAANDAGFYMAHQSAVDYFEVYQIEGRPQRLRLALFMPGKSTCLYMGNEGDVGVGEFDYSGKSAFFLVTDNNGYSTVSTVIEHCDQTYSYKLVMDQDGRIAGLSTANNSYHLWAAEMQSNPAKEDRHLKSAMFTLYNVGYMKEFAQKLYLSTDGLRIQGSLNPLLWELAMESLAPGTLHADDIQLYTFQRDEVFRPSIFQVGSQPIRWTLSPDLPDFMSFDEVTGVISQMPGVAPTIRENESYHITVMNSFGTSEADFNMNITVNEF